MTELAAQIEAAFDYRGYVTIVRHDGGSIAGFIYDRGASHVELYDETATQRIRLAIADIAAIELTGDDSAAKAQRIWERRIDGLEPPDTSEYGDWDAQRGALVIAAMPRELRRVARALGTLPRGSRAIGRLDDTTVVATAIGIGAGVEAAARAIAAERPRLVIACGLAGGIDPRLATGSIVLASSAGDIAADPALLAAARERLPHALVGPFVSTARVATRPAMKRTLAPAIAVDLETRAIAMAARDAGLPWLAVRAIVDPVDVALPGFVANVHASFVVGAIAHALRGHLLQLVTLAGRAHRAECALERAIAVLGPVVRS